MLQKVTHLTVLVHDQEEALKFYTQMLGFEIHTDATFEEMRWLTVHPEGQADFEIVLFPAHSEETKALVGKQAADGIFFSLSSDNCQADYEALSAKGVNFIHPPKAEGWGTAALCEDLYGNAIYIVQSKE